MTNKLNALTSGLLDAVKILNNSATFSFVEHSTSFLCRKDLRTAMDRVDCALSLIRKIENRCRKVKNKTRTR